MFSVFLKNDSLLRK